MHPEVSIVIAVFNAGCTLERMVRSIRAQTYRSFELIIVDDGSTDGGKTAETIERLASEEPRIRHVKVPNGGPSSARKAGIDLARGKWVYICDQDDFLHPQLLEYAVRTLMRESAEILMFRHSVQDDDSRDPSFPPIGDIDSTPVRTFDLGKPEGMRGFISSARLDVWEVFAERWAVGAVSWRRGGYDTSFVFKLMRMAKKAVLSPLELYSYNRAVSASMSRRPISVKDVESLHAQILEYAAVFSREIRSGDRDGIWGAVRRHVVAGSVKRRLKPIALLAKSDRQAAREVRRALAAALSDLRGRGVLRLSDLRLRPRILIAWMLMRYR